MRIQIADNDGAVLYVPALNAHLERDLFELFPKHPAYRWLKNRRTRHAVKTIEEALWKLRLDTRFATGEAGGEDVP